MEILKHKGWRPERIDPYSGYGIGAPDFKCSDNRFVEVKKITRGQSPLINIYLTQLNKILELSNNGRIFIMVFNNDLSNWDLFEIKGCNKE